MKSSINIADFRCDNCGSGDLSIAYNVPNSLRNLNVYVCKHCSLSQSLPRIDHVADRPKRVSSGAAWGNIRYGKAFITNKSIDILEKFIDLKRNLHFIDIGSNRGSLINALYQKYPNLNITAVEPDKRVINDYENNPNLECIFDRVENINFNDKSFDVVYSAHTIEHLKSPKKILGNIRKWVKDNAVCYFEVPNLLSINQDNLIEEFFIDKHLYHYSLTSFIDLIESSGFDIFENGVFTDNDNLRVVCKPSKKIKNNKFNRQDEAQKIHNLHIKYAEKLKSNIEKLKKVAINISSICKDRKVVFWGAGRIFDSIVVNGGFDTSLLHGLVDKNLPNFIEEMHGKRVLFTSEIKNLAPEVIIIASRAYAKEIISEINELNLDVEILSFDKLIA
tara:strand:- start:1047 stop:2219 length:1173 start_codon:yes stop_codon:yes gene_type:complete